MKKLVLLTPLLFSFTSLSVFADDVSSTENELQTVQEAYKESVAQDRIAKAFGSSREKSVMALKASKETLSSRLTYLMEKAKKASEDAARALEEQAKKEAEKAKEEEAKKAKEEAEKASESTIETSVSTSSSTPSTSSSTPVGNLPAASSDDLAVGLTVQASRVKQLIGSMFSVSDYSLFRAGDQDHGTGKAVDFMVYSDSAKGNEIADYLVKHFDELGLSYIIWQQKFYSPYNNIYGAGGTWNLMPDRGGTTANHYDHVHVSFK